MFSQSPQSDKYKLKKKAKNEASFHFEDLAKACTKSVLSKELIRQDLQGTERVLKIKDC